MGVGRDVRQSERAEKILETLGYGEEGGDAGWASGFLLQCTAWLWLWQSRISTSIFPASQKAHTLTPHVVTKAWIPRAQLRASTLALKYRWIYCICQIISGTKFPGRPWLIVRKMFGRVPRMRKKHLTTCIFINKIATLGNVSIQANVSVNTSAFTSNKCTALHRKQWWQICVPN